MQIEFEDFNQAVKARIISTSQAKELWDFLEKEREHTPQFRFAHLLYYFGGLLMIAAVTLFVTQAWEKLLGFPLFIFSLLLFLLGIFLTHYFINKKLFIPAGILATFSLALIPLAVYNLQNSFGFTPPSDNYQYANFHYWVNWYWVPMELITLLVGVIMFYFYDFPFLLFPVSIVLWYMSMDLWPLLFNVQNLTFSHRAMFSMYFGLVIILAALYLDFKYDNVKKDYAFWLYIIGVITFWGGLTSQESTSELSKFFYCLINLFMILLSVFLNRRVFAVFGALGVLGYLGHLAFSIFEDSFSFTIALIFLGLIIIFLATKWPMFEKKLFKTLRPYMPQKIIKRIHR